MTQLQPNRAAPWRALQYRRAAPRRADRENALVQALASIAAPTIRIARTTAAKTGRVVGPATYARVRGTLRPAAASDDSTILRPYRDEQRWSRPSAREPALRRRRTRGLEEAPNGRTTTRAARDRASERRVTPRRAGV